MQAARIAELLSPFLPAAAEERDAPSPLSIEQIECISIYIDLLIRWNARVNLTAIRDAEHIVNRHFGESLFAARQLFPVPPPPGLAAADIGSGAGFPGLPLKLWAPGLQLTLVESNHKKVAFLREVVRSLRLTNVNILNVRAETLPPHTFNLVTLRAVERFDAILPVAARLVASGGRMALLIGSSQQAVAQSLLPGWTWIPSQPVPLSTSRILLIGENPATTNI